MTNNNPPVSGIEGHTAGPWHASLRFGGSPNGASVVGANGDIVARITVAADKPFDRKRADLALIASAPTLKQQRDELLEALKHLSHEAELFEAGTKADGRPNNNDLLNALDHAQAAIRKAEGGEG